MLHVTVWLAFAAGVLSFVSPCTLPLFPSYIGYITGVSFRTLQENQENTPRYRRQAILHSLSFCIGLSVLFVLLGFGASAIGSIIISYRTPIRIVGGSVVIVMGLVMANVLRWQWFLRERRFMPAVKPAGYIGSALVGVAFATGWTPCIGPILGSVLMMVISNPSQGFTYMLAYALGFSIPFVVLAATLSSIRRLLPYTGAIAKTGGWLLVCMGILLLTNKMAGITIWIQRVTGYRGF